MLGNDTITVVYAAPRDADGDPTGPAAEVDISGCYVQPDPSGSAETLGTGDTVTTRLRVFGPPGADIPADAQIRWRGVLHQVDGRPAAWGTPDGAAHHMEITMTRLEG